MSRFQQEKTAQLATPGGHATGWFWLFRGRGWRLGLAGLPGSFQFYLLLLWGLTQPSTGNSSSAFMSAGRWLCRWGQPLPQGVAKAPGSTCRSHSTSLPSLVCYVDVTSDSSPWQLLVALRSGSSRFQKCFWKKAGWEGKGVEDLKTGHGGSEGQSSLLPGRFFPQAGFYSLISWRKNDHGYINGGWFH